VVRIAGDERRLPHAPSSPHATNLLTSRGFRSDEKSAWLMS
jgi:hypothetical protein